MLTHIWRGAGRGAAALLLVAGAPAIAAVPPKVAQGGEQGGDAIVRRAADLATTGDCVGVLRLLDPLVVREPVSSASRFSAQLLRMPCLASVGRGAEIPPVLAELKAKAPTHPLVLGFEVFADAQAGRTAQAADELAALADTGSPALQLMPGTLWRALAQQLGVAGDHARRERTALALARAGWAPADAPDLAETLAVQGIGALLDQNDPDQAAGLLKRVTRPGALWDMAIQRRFAPLWPAIETRLGPASGTVADRYARAALGDFAVETGDDHARLVAVRAFGALGRGADVIATAEPVAVAARMSEDRVEIVLDDAEARAAGGDQAAAISRLAPFGKLDLATTPEASSALISFAEALHEGGRYADELALVRPLLASSTSPFSAFGRAWLLRSDACAAHALGRGEEARAAGDTLKAHAVDNEAAAAEGLLCLDRDDEAAVIVVRALATPDGTDRVADQFQPTGALFMHPPSKTRALWARLLARRDVAAAFDRAARILPKSLWPATTPRPLPAPAASDDPSLTTT